MSLVKRYRRRYENCDAAADEGFTLIELLVVLLIIGILLAIAIPTFLGVTKGANNTAAQSNLQTALTGAKAYYTNNNQTYGTSAQLIAGEQGVGTGLTYQTTASANNSQISVAATTDGSGTLFATYSPGTTTCWGIIDFTVAQSTATLGQTAVGTYFFDIHGATATSCVAATYLAAASAPTAGSGAGNGYVQANGFPTS